MEPTTWEEKLMKLKELAPGAHLEMRAPGDWYVSASMYVKDGQMMRGEFGNGPTPGHAVIHHWEIYRNKVAYTGAWGDGRGFVFHNGAWIEVK